MNHWHLLGAGAMGSLMSYRLDQARCACTLLHHHREPAQRTVIDADKAQQLAVLPLAALRAGSVQRLLLTTKAGQLTEALSLALPYLSDDAVIATTANGLGFESALAALAPGHPLHRAVSTAAAFRDSAGVVHVTATGTTRMGLPGTSSQAPDWFNDSLATLQGWSWDNSIEQLIGEKFAINCVINPLTASLGCRNGKLIRGRKARTALTALCRESEPVLRQLGLWRRPGSLEDAALEICNITAENQSSMLQDVMADRATEIPYLNGELVRRAAALGLDLPHNRRLVSQLG